MFDLTGCALGSATLSEPSLNRSWWVAVDKMHYTLMADVSQGSSLEPVRWYKCGMKQDQANLNNMDLAHIEVWKHRGWAYS